MDKGIKRILILLIAIVLFVISLVLNNFQILRLLLFFISLLLLIYQSIMERKNKRIIGTVFLLIYTTIFIVTDYCVAYKFEKKGVLMLKTISIGEVKVYDSFLYRLWQCNKNVDDYIFDNKTKIGNFCNTENIKSVGINSFYPELIENYKRYENTFIRLYGRINEIEDQYYVLNTYSVENGEVKYDRNLTIYVYYDNYYNNNYQVGDVIDVIGRVSELDKAGEKIIVYLKDTMIYQGINKEFKVSIIKNDNKTNKFFTYNNVNYYSSGIENVFLDFDDGNTYDLNTALESGIIYFNLFLEKANGFDHSNNLIMFKYNDFSVIKCSDNKYIFGSNISLDGMYCEIQ